MQFFFKLKHHFFGAFRELFVHHHGSLEFRAKIFALVISADEDASVENYVLVKQIASNIYTDDEDRANLLTLTTKENVKKVRDYNGLDIDTLITSIQRDLKVIPRYAKKIDIPELKKFLSLANDPDTLSYQENILEFLQKLKNDTLKNSKIEITQDENILSSEEEIKKS